ncbi:hypothetical protein SteCoe_16273 [Stentor coeruleus]|uniref:E2F/DP family winged-helix DNA-binding domain-containing protein n=1 Tax=Stentor coeruleus TaxID=5963 RepID=A0A1R2C1V9_9CILI|nr:hypothetical protein SteCoe_16273 [Stentor coeruleus]
MEQEEHGLTPLPQSQDLSNSTLWSETSMMPKVHKTLKQLSQEVKQYIMEKGHCTYKEVADEIVKKEACYNEKNIRRRVYDAINVLTAVNIFEKRGKQVCIVEKNCSLIRSNNKKRDALRKLAMRYQNLCGIVVRNSELPQYREAIQMPFIVVFTKKNAHIETELIGNSLKVTSNKILKIMKSLKMLQYLNINTQNVLPDELVQLLN